MSVNAKKTMDKGFLVSSRHLNERRILDSILHLIDQL